MRTYEGAFNYQGEIWRGTTEAKSKQHAFNKLTVGMSKRYGIENAQRLRNYFLSKGGSYELKEVTGWTGANTSLEDLLSS